MTLAETRLAVALAFGIAGVGVASARAGVPPTSSVTFTRDVAPILFANCVQCHHQDGAAPFSLLTYESARSHAQDIVKATKDRYMPPWKAEPGYGGPFVGQHDLTDAEIETLRRWAEEGAAEGDPADLPPAPKLTAGWELGTPALILRLPRAYHLQASGTDVFRVFVIPIPTSQIRYVRGLEFHPGNPAVVHHANIRIDETPASREMDEADPEPGYQDIILRSARYPDGYFLGWTPGQVRPLLPENLAWRLSPHTDLVVEIHMRPDGHPELVNPEIGLFFGRDPPDRTPVMLRLGSQRIDIPPGDPSYTITDSYVLPVEAQIEALQPHAHYRAREIRGIATLPDGTRKWLIYIKNWDFRWQHVYELLTPLSVPKGTTLSMRYTYDNSAANRNNPQLPPRRVTWGQRSQDEMGDLWIQVLTRSLQDRETLVSSFRPKALTEDTYGDESELARDPDNVQMQDDAAMLYLDLGKTDLAIRHFAASAKLQPDSAPAHFNLGTALLTADRFDDAAREFREAIRLKPDYAVAHNNLGTVLYARGRTSEAIAEFSAALASDPSNVDAHVSLGYALRETGDLRGAIDQYRQAVALQPDSAAALANLSWLLATSPDVRLRKPGRAVELAQRAADLTERKDAQALDVLAAAYAADGAFDRAVEATNAALRLNVSRAAADTIRSHRDLYEQHRPFIERPGHR
jgi:tetratricopeptide (TPR) repeat protein/mono/diheme cytochrome c family protein